MGDSHLKKIALILLVICSGLSIILFDGSIDDFAPKHIPVIRHTSEQGELEDNLMTVQIPGFYVYGVIVSEICGLDPKCLLFLPFQLLPLIITVYYLAFIISKNYVLSAVIASLHLLSGLTGTAKIYFWPHTLGLILYILFVAILFFTITNNRKISEYLLLLILLGSSIVFLSYNYAALVMLITIALSSLLGVAYLYYTFNSSKISLILYSKRLIRILFIISVVELGLSKFFYDSYIPTINSAAYIELPSVDRLLLYSKRLIRILFIISIVELGLSKFFYDSYIPTINSAAYIELPSVDRFLLNYFALMVTQNPLNEHLIVYPSLITFLNLTKYGLLLFSIVIFLLYSINKFLSKNINAIDFVLIAIILSTFTYAIPRVYIGGTAVDLIYFPGILCSVWLYRFSYRFKRTALFTILFIFFIILPLNYIVLWNNELVNKDYFQYDSLRYPSFWFNNKAENISVASDELTKNFFSIYMPLYNYNLTKRFNNNDLLFIYGEKSKLDISRYYLLNFKLKWLSIDNWAMLKSWNHAKTVVDRNTNLFIVYNNGCLYICLNP